MSKRVLLTAGRAPATLDLARILHGAGHAVFVLDTTRWCMCAVSRAVKRLYTAPWPSRSPAAFIDRLVEVLERERIDLLIPTFEEIFCIARVRDRLRRHCELSVDSYDTLCRLHHKWQFIEWAAQLGLPTPHTQLLSDREALDAAMASGRDLVFKPVYSRFSNRTIVPQRGQGLLDRIEIDEHRPWVAQEFVRGRQLSTYSVAIDGRLTAHAAYPTDFEAFRGLAINFRPIDHIASLEWVRSFVSQIRFTGQIAFDFIETPSGTTLPLECNPRTTSGVHLFADGSELPRAFIGHDGPAITPGRVRPMFLGGGMLSYLLARVRSFGHLRRWARIVVGSRDVTFRLRDPLPFFFQFLGLGWLMFRGLRYKRHVTDAGVIDLAWNGEQDTSREP